MTAYWGAAVVHGNTAYFSKENIVYSYSLAKDEWTRLPPCECDRFGMAVVNDKVTTIGGRSGVRASNTLVCLEDRGAKLLPPMPKATIGPATVTTPTHLIVAGGRIQSNYIGDSNALSWIQVLDTTTLQWSLASSSPKASKYPCVSLCGERLYLSNNCTVHSCSVEELLKSCKPASSKSSVSGSVWTKLSDIPVPHHSILTTVRGHVITIGGSNKIWSGTPTGAIHQYNRSTNSWSVIGEMPIPRYNLLVAVLPSNELIVVGGVDRGKNTCDITIIASTE